jgi:hypothetical protein
VAGAVASANASADVAGVAGAVVVERAGRRRRRHRRPERTTALNHPVS